jgi:hypothetical protein
VGSPKSNQIAANQEWLGVRIYQFPCGATGERPWATRRLKLMLGVNDARSITA